MPHSVTLLGLQLLAASGCASWRQGSTLAFYQGAVLDGAGVGHGRVDIESAVDPTVDAYVALHGPPDFLFVGSLRDIELIYLKDDKLVHFHRSVSAGFSPDFQWRSSMTEVSPLPEPLLDLLPTAGAQVRQARGR
jgi:hypothetical protein